MSSILYRNLKFIFCKVLVGKLYESRLAICDIAEVVIVDRMIIDQDLADGEAVCTYVQIIAEFWISFEY